MKAEIVEKVINKIKKACKVKKGSGGKLRDYDVAAGLFLQKFWRNSVSTPSGVFN